MVGKPFWNTGGGKSAVNFVFSFKAFCDIESYKSGFFLHVYVSCTVFIYLACSMHVICNFQGQRKKHYIGGLFGRLVFVDEG